MSRRTGRSEMPNDPAAMIRALCACRGAMLDVLRVVKPMGPAYHAASMVMSAIDGFASFMTGERYYFAAGSSTPLEPQRGRETPAGRKDESCP